jgi:predicted RNA-binding Zn-ribbon protein involved in translation (DUF1610 family)
MFVDLTFINQIAPSLQKFKWTRQSSHSVFRCPYCGDSKKNPYKTRGNLFKFKDGFVYKCHNCGVSKSLGTFIKDHFPYLTQEYRLEKFKEATGNQNKPFVIPKLEDESEQVIVTPKTVSIQSLPDDHPARLYVLGRKIPEDRLDDIGYTENFAQWVFENSGADKYKKLPRDERIIFELRDASGNLFGVQGRALNKLAKVRYITIKFDDNKPKVFGAENLNTSQPIFVTEGPIDSMFLPNALAICGGDVSVSLSGLVGKDVTIALDNEPRSKDTVSRMEAAISQGFSVCFWKIDPRLKDINDMILAGYTQNHIVEHIRQNSYKGIKAKVQLSMWKKV